MDDKSHLPLLGAIVCCTSIPPEQRTHLATSAEQMGAVHKFDLTSDVTHLIVGDTDTRKYKFVAKERLDVKCLMPSWIEAVRELWMASEDVNVTALEEQHKLPTFYGLKICVTGFADPDYRKILEDKITANGGDYKPNLTKEETHLVAKEPCGAKYDFADRYGIKIVEEDWLDQSLERGMILEPSLFHPLIPLEKRGAGAWVRKTTSTTSLGKHAREESRPERSRKLRRTASAKLEHANSGLWGDIVIQEAQPELQKKSVWDEEEPRKEIIKQESSDQRGSDQTAFAPSQASSFVDLRNKSVRGSDLFYQKTFFLHGFDDKKTSVLESHLTSRGGKIGYMPSFASEMASHDPESIFLIVPHNIQQSEIPSVGEGLKSVLIVTELWVERCLHLKKWQHPSTHVMNRPLPKLPIPGFERLTICSTGFQGVDLLHMSKAVKLMGATYDEFFDSKASILICNASHSSVDKLHHARLWSKPAVRVEWLWDSLSRSKMMPFEPHLVQPIMPPVEIDSAKSTVQTSEQFSRPKIDARTSRSESESSAAKARSITVDGDPRNRRKGAPSIGKQQNRNIDPFPDDAGPSLFDNTKHTDTEPNKEHPVANQSSSTNLRSSASLPLREITPNSSPPKPPSAPPQDDINNDDIQPPPPPSNKPTPTPSPLKPLSSYHEDSTLGPTISSLLAHQRSHSIANKSAPNSPRPRRRRQLLGRAPSNLSSGGGAAGNFSRASSVDTLNTDGLGTPLSATGSSFPNFASRPGTAGASGCGGQAGLGVVYDTNHQEEEERKKQEEQLLLTQVGYQDPDALVWKERVSRKIRGEKVVYGKTPKKGVSLVDVGDRGLGGKGGGGGGDGGLGIAKRTRGAVGAR